MKVSITAICFGLSALVAALPAHAVPNLALGADASASDNGWGGGTRKSDLTDGLATYYDTWAHGLAAPWMPSGDFNVVLKFSTDLTFNTVTAWWHGTQYGANNVRIQSWDSATSDWVTVYSTTNALASVGFPDVDDISIASSSPTTFQFATVTSEALRLTFDNSEVYYRTGMHGWLYEVAVNYVPIPEPETWAMLLAGLGIVCAVTRRQA